MFALKYQDRQEVGIDDLPPSVTRFDDLSRSVTRFEDLSRGVAHFQPCT